MSVEVLTRRQLNRATLARQMLLQRESIGVVAAVERLGGMQAQEPKPPFTGLWTRLTNFQRGDLHRSLHEREVVRGTLMRGTLHLMSADDYVAHRTTLQPVLTRALKLLGDRAAGLEPDAMLATARTLLAAQPRTFTDLRGSLAIAFPDVNERALGFTVRMSLPLLMIPTAARWAFPADAQFGSAEQWLGTPLAADADPRALMRRYLAAFGPATAADFQQWSGLQAVKPMLETMRPELAVFRDKRRRELFDLPEAPRPEAEIPAPPRFLPEFDNLLLSHADRSRVLADEHRRAVLGAKNGRIPGTFLVDGFVAGTWRTQRKKNAATLTFSPFAPLTGDAATALAAEGEAMLRFLEEDASSFDVIQWLR
ncbi:MAG: winged helix DNA-binding domain-containing protein [Chloroflexia bacterium]|nr:winged helix DNA-binding domain-containing protein [Chloroflexia bacterium]